MVGSAAPEGGGGAGRGDWTRALREAAPYLGIGTSFAASVLLGLGIGYWLDRRFGTQPWLFLVGAVFGLVAGFVQFYKTVTSGKKQ
jgi:ATP synthase protein I